MYVGDLLRKNNEKNEDVMILKQLKGLIYCLRNLE